MHAQEILQKYEPRASVVPAALHFADCPYMWPFCAQPLYAGAMPLMFNATVLNGMGLTGAPHMGLLRVLVRGVQETGDHLRGALGQLQGTSTCSHAYCLRCTLDAGVSLAVPRALLKELRLQRCSCAV